MQDAAWIADVKEVKGFLDAEEGKALHEAALVCAPLGPCMEIGSYCGKSTVYIGMAVRVRGGVLYALDHHYGSEENQQGWFHHDPALFDPETGKLDTLPHFRRTLRRFDLENTVVPLVAPSAVAARGWSTPLAMLFIDGGHGETVAHDDYRLWTPHVMPGGILAIHDVFPNSEDGGRPPYEIYCLALRSKFFEEIRTIKSLKLLRRTAYSPSYE